MNVADLNPDEQGKLAHILKRYFPELGTNKEMNGGDVVEELCNLYKALPQVSTTSELIESINEFLQENSQNLSDAIDWLECAVEKLEEFNK